MWPAFADLWELNCKVAFNGVDRTITVNDDVTELDIQRDVWSRYADWRALPGNDYHEIAMRKTGYDLIPGGRSGVIYFLINGWKLIYDPSKTGIRGSLYSDDYPSPYFSLSGHLVYPAVVSALVNQSVTTQNVITGDISNIPAPPSLVELAEAVWSATVRTLTSQGMTPEQISEVVWSNPNALTLRKYIGLT